MLATADPSLRAPGPPPPALPGFEGINRYWDLKTRTFAAKVLPGEFYVTGSDEMLVTILGSCVSACMRNPATGLGGMNHFLLPETTNTVINGVDEAALYGFNAMELLINALLKGGGKRGQLEVKIFGGGKMFDRMGDHGAKNVDFVRDYVSREGLKLRGEDVCGPYSRKVRFYPDTGRVQVRRISRMKNATLETRESDYLKTLSMKPLTGDAELF